MVTTAMASSAYFTIAIVSWNGLSCWLALPSCSARPAATTLPVVVAAPVAGASGGAAVSSARAFAVAWALSSSCSPLRCGVIVSATIAFAAFSTWSTRASQPRP